MDVTDSEHSRPKSADRMIDVAARWDDPVRPPVPGWLCLMIYPTLRCNLRCNFCYQQSFKTTLDRSVLFEKLKPVYPATRELQFVGGEVTVLPWAKEYLLWLAANYPDIKLHMITNGVRLDRGWQEMIVDLSIDTVISLNAPTAEDFASVVASPRPGELWRSVLKNVVELLDRARRYDDVRVDISMVVTDESLRFMERFVVLAKQLGTGCRLAFDCRPSGSADWRKEMRNRVQTLRRWLAPLHLRAVGLGPIDRLADAAAPIPRDRKRWDRWAATPLDDIYPEVAAHQASQAAGLSPDRPKRYSSEGQFANFGAARGMVNGRPGCLAPWRSLVITAWGDVLTCPNLAGRPLGNINEAPIDEIWNSPSAIALRRRLLAGEYGACPTNCETNPASAHLVALDAGGASHPSKATP